jgi:type II secretory pathway pseudopilin PulG
MENGLLVVVALLGLAATGLVIQIVGALRRARRRCDDLECALRGALRRIDALKAEQRSAGAVLARALREKEEAEARERDEAEERVAMRRAAGSGALRELSQHVR